jgi:signal transduction histidine kinase
MLAFANTSHPQAEVMVVHNTVSQLPEEASSLNTVWIDAREPERSIVRTIKLLVRADRSRQLLSAAVQAPTESENRRLELEQESRNKDEFLATMSHELRTPLNAILSCTEAMREGAYGLLIPEQLAAVQTIRESGKHLLCLITDILDISKIEAGRLELNSSTFGVQAICDSVTEMMRSAAQDKGVQLLVENKTDIQTLKGDPLRVKQILLNL